jgi:hypothetical protein
MGMTHHGLSSWQAESEGIGGGSERANGLTGRTWNVWDADTPAVCPGMTGWVRWKNENTGRDEATGRHP